MTDRRRERAEELCGRALALPNEERQAYLDGACADTPELRRHVELLIDARASTASRLAFDDRRDGVGELVRTPPDVPGYELLRCIGRGGMGEVWLGRNPTDHQFYAIKIVDPRSTQELEGLREYKHRIAEHPNLVPIQHVGVADGRCYYIMPLADDANDAPVVLPEKYEPLTLEGRLRRNRRMEPAEVLVLARDTLEGLIGLNAHGAQHGDIKPANIIRRRGNWQLTDHGLVGVLGSRPRGCTPAYRPPEGSQSETADLYALGVTLFEAATGATPGDVPKFLSGGLSVPGDDDLSRGLARIIRRACSPVASRFTSPVAMRDALRLVDPGRRRSRWPMVAAATLVVAAVVAVVVVTRDRVAPTTDPTRAQAAVAMGPPEVQDFSVLRIPPGGEEIAGTLDGSPGSTKYALAGEGLEISVMLDREAYCYLIAFNPDGGRRLFYPGAESIRPISVLRVDAPVDEEGEGIWYPLSPGSHALVLVASKRPLDPYDRWSDVASLPAWPLSSRTLACLYNGTSVRPLAVNRDDPVFNPRRGPVVEFAKFCKTLEEDPAVDLVYVVAFPVEVSSDVVGDTPTTREDVQ